MTPIPSRENRLESVKTISAAQMLPSAEEATRLFTAANSGSGLGLAPATNAPPYTPAVINALAIAALAAMGAAGDDARANTEALSIETNAQFCLDMSKLNLFSAWPPRAPATRTCSAWGGTSCATWRPAPRRPRCRHRSRPGSDRQPG